MPARARGAGSTARRDVVVASHNLMHGRRLGGLVRHHQYLANRVGLDVLCLQEDGPGDGTHHGDHIAATLGPSYRRIIDPLDPSMSVVYDADRVEPVEHRLIPLPSLSRLSWLERRYIAGGKPDRRHAQVVRFAHAHGEPLAVVNFHLETAGCTEHRRRQLEVLARALCGGRGVKRAVACGDTNSFTWRRRQHARVLRRVLAPLEALGLRDVGLARPTHYFARAHEPILPHRIGVFLGRLGLDLPMRFDVLCTDLPVAHAGHLVTPESDHDLVWARLAC